NELVFSQFGEDGDHGQTADEFGDEAEAEQVLGFDMLQDFLAIDGRHFRAVIHRAKTHDVLAEAAVDYALETNESAAADEEDVGGINADIFLLRMFASAL